MKRTIYSLATVAVLSVAGSAQALDWSGLYVGGHLGSTNLSGAMDAYTPYNDYDGFDLQGTGGHAGVGGLQAGYNWDQGTYVFGIEATLTAGGPSTTTTSSDLRGEVPEFSRSLDGMGTLTPRIGFKAGNALVYAKAGLAMAKLGVSHDQGDLIKGSSTENGWTIGLGVEVPATDRMTWKIEYNYADFGNVRTDMAGSPDIYTIQKAKTNSIFVGFNYYFK